MKRKILRIILLVIFLVGISILLYPFISQYYNSLIQSQDITDYNKILTKIEDKDYSNMLEDADDYNYKLSKLDFPLIQYKKISHYLDLIDVNGNGMMGYISIDKIKVELPIYHGTNLSVLNNAVGHLEGSSFPVGGDTTHSVLSAHRGLPSAKLFTNLNKLEIGDIFVINVIDRKLTYQVDKIVVIEPSDISNLEIIDGRDYVTLMTCTPYGLNTHRLLVRGTRISNESNLEIVITSDAYQIDRLVITLVISLFILLVLIIYVMIRPVR